MVENSMIPRIILETDEMRIERIVKEKLNGVSPKPQKQHYGK